MLRAALAAIFVGLLLQPIAIRMLRVHGVFDSPTARSSHTIPTVRGGGIVFVISITLGASLCDHSSGSIILVAIMVLCSTVGLVEDIRGLSIAVRFTLVLAAAAPLALVVDMGSAFKLALVTLGVVFVAATVNATNFMDGINGISAAQGVACGGAYALLASSQHLGALAGVAAAVVGGSIGFAPYNLPRARVFLGDVGSYGLGAVLGGLAVLLLARGVTPEAALSPLAIALADTGATLSRRVLRGDAWYLPHRTHVYQRLTASGLSHTGVSTLVMLLVLGCSLLGAVSLATSSVDRIFADLALLGLVLLYLKLPTLSRVRLGKQRRREARDSGEVVPLLHGRA